MYVITITNVRKKMFSFLKIILIGLVLLTVLFFIFDQLASNMSMQTWQSANDHPGRILRVDFGEQSSTFENTIQKLKQYYQQGLKKN